MAKAQHRTLDGVPLCGKQAFRQGWDVDCHCPHEPDTVAAMMWRSDWWRANAEAFADNIGQEPPKSALAKAVEQARGGPAPPTEMQRF